MKSYEEVTRDLLKRRDEYETMKTKRQKNAFRAAVPVCTAVLAAAGIGLWRSGITSKLPIESESSCNSESNPMADIIFFDKNDREFALSDFGLKSEDFVSMTFDEMLEYYGAEIRPDVPGDLKNCNPDYLEYSVYKRDGGTGEIYWDTTSLVYCNGTESRTISVEAAKGRIPPTCCIVESDDMQKSLISGVEVLLPEGNKDFMYAEFMAAGVGFRIQAVGLSHEELVEVVRSLIEKNQIVGKTE